MARGKRRARRRADETSKERAAGTVKERVAEASRALDRVTLVLTLVGVCAFAIFTGYLVGQYAIRLVASPLITNERAENPGTRLVDDEGEGSRSTPTPSQAAQAPQTTQTVQSPQTTQTARPSQTSQSSTTPAPASTSSQPVAPAPTASSSAATTGSTTAPAQASAAAPASSARACGRQVHDLSRSGRQVCQSQ